MLVAGAGIKILHTFLNIHSCPCNQSYYYLKRRDREGVQHIELLMPISPVMHLFQARFSVGADVVFNTLYISLLYIYLCEPKLLFCS